MPIWAFHGSNDVVLPVSMSEKSVDACQKLAKRTAELKFSRIPVAGGSDPSWVAAGIPDMPGHGGMNVEAYYPPGSPPYPLYEWLLKFRLGKNKDDL